MGNIILSNVVDKKKLREVQKKTLNDVASYLKTSFGPFGSNSIIKTGMDAKTEYTKDGHDILSRIKYNGPIEGTVIDDLVDVTKHVVKTVGDGTTSAVEMSNFIFNGLADLEAGGRYTAYDIIFTFKKVITEICDRIKENAKECTLDDIYNIAYTATNGNERLTQNLYDLYKDYGFDIYIDLQVALSSQEDIIKIYDGMTLDDGFTDSAYANTDKGLCELRNPHIYIFEDPVDTPEMIMLFDKIIHDNIMSHYSRMAGTDNTNPPIPTVIIAPAISGDMSSYMTHMVEFINQYPKAQKPPIVIIRAYTHRDQMSDIATMCGAPAIKKYINDEIRANDIKKGLAPDIDTISNFFGTCEMISVSEDSTKVVRPKNMFKDDGEYTESFNNLLSWCEAELERLKANNATTTEIYNLKRRINSLKSNLIEYFVGGIALSDRDNDRASLEDAIKNCRSAIVDGVGSGANVEGFKVLYDIHDDDTRPTLEQEILDIIYNAYEDILDLLYKPVFINKVEELRKLSPAPAHTNTNIDDIKIIKDKIMDDFYQNLIDHGAYNLRTDKFDGKVETSILSDVVILQAISQIITRMATAEQFILPTPQHNVYMAVEDK